MYIYSYDFFYIIENVVFKLILGISINIKNVSFSEKSGRLLHQFVVVYVLLCKGFYYRFKYLQ